jgi:hypothetical protein
MPITRLHSPSSFWTKKSVGRHDTYGSALSAQPGESQRRPATNSSSQLIQYIGLPALRAPGASVPDGRTIRQNRGSWPDRSAPPTSYRLPTRSNGSTRKSNAVPMSCASFPMARVVCGWCARSRSRPMKTGSSSIATSTWTICANTRRRRCDVLPDPRPVQPSTVLALSRTLRTGSAGAAAVATVS